MVGLYGSVRSRGPARFAPRRALHISTLCNVGIQRHGLPASTHPHPSDSAPTPVLGQGGGGRFKARGCRPGPRSEKPGRGPRHACGVARGRFGSQARPPTLARHAALPHANPSPQFRRARQRSSGGAGLAPVLRTARPPSGFMLRAFTLARATTVWPRAPSNSLTCRSGHGFRIPGRIRLPGWSPGSHSRLAARLRLSGRRAHPPRFAAWQGGCARLSRIRDSPRPVRHPLLESELQSCRHGGLGKCESVAPEPLKNGFRPEKRSKKIRVQILFLSSLRAVPVFRAAVFFNGNPARRFHLIFRDAATPHSGKLRGELSSNL